MRYAKHTLFTCLALAAIFFSTACKQDQALAPVTDVGCSIETSITAALAGAIATTLNCTSASSIQSSLQTALGNVNLCATTTAAAAKMSGTVNFKGIVGDIACPIVINTVTGYLTNRVPGAWGCSTITTGAAISTVIRSLTTACVAVVPI